MRENDHIAESRSHPGAREDPIRYRHSDLAQALMIAELGSLMNAGARKFCDVGAGANPIVSTRRIERLGLDYTILDDSQSELEKAPAGYLKFRSSILDSARISELLSTHGPFDVVTSRWTAEHVPDGRVFHQQVYDMLGAGGAAVHLFPTLFSPVFLMNRLLPGSASAAILERGSEGGRGDEGPHAKFRSYYSWCRGPSVRQLERLRSIGFSVERYFGFFGHGYYRRLKPIDRLHRAATDILLSHPLPSMTSFALMVLRRD